MVYITADNEAQLWQRIQDTTNNIRGDEEVMQRVCFNFLRRIHFCISVNGR